MLLNPDIIRSLLLVICLQDFPGLHSPPPPPKKEGKPKLGCLPPLAKSLSLHPILKKQLKMSWLGRLLRNLN